MHTSPGGIRPEFLGIIWPSMGTWMWIYLGLIALVLLLQFIVWGYYLAIGDDQYDDPETRARMNLGARVSMFGSRIRPALERLAEPQRSHALAVYTVLNVALGAVVAAAALTIAIYWHLVLPN